MAATVRTTLLELIDSTNDVENKAKHASPEFKAAQSRGNALRNAVKTLTEF